jgi:aspartate/methionine/tyrosine aminotransferase
MELGPEIIDSLELKFSALARRKNQSGEKIISFGLGEPDFPTPPPVVEAAVEAMRNGHTRYSNPLGLWELRERICEKLERENGIHAQPDQIVVTPGAKMALSLVLGALLRPGDEIVNITPCYPSYVPQIKIAEPAARIRNIDLLKKNFGLNRDALASAIHPNVKAVLLNFPHNPTGKMLSAADLDWLVTLLADHRDCFVISDEIYERLNHSGMRHVSPGAREELALRTITINGFSKAFSMTGWRIGYLYAPESLIRPISRLQQHMNTNTATFVQKAAIAAFDISSEYLDDYNARLDRNARVLRSMAERHSTLGLVPSEGGLFAFLRISGTGMDSDAFATNLLEHAGVAATPGIVFGREWGDHVRISLAIEPSEFEEGVHRLDAFVRSRC